jgi:tetratricopeptide (TPR) repeat protein
MRKQCLFLVVLIAGVFAPLLGLGSQAVAATAADFRDEGKAALQAKQYEEAEAAYRAAYAMDADNVETLLGLGTALSRQGKTKEAETYLRQALIIDQDSPKVNLELGKLYAKMNVMEEAEDFYSIVSEIAPNTEYDREARRLMKETKETRKGEKPWAVGVGLGIQYDSNVITAADATPPPEGISDKSDWRSIVTLAGSYQFLDTSRFAAGASYSFYQSLHQDISEYNVRAHSPKLSLLYKYSDGLVFRAGYGFDHITMDEDVYSQSHKVTAGLSTVLGGRGMVGSVEYAFTDASYEDSDRFLTNSERDGQTHEGALALFVPLTDKVNLVASGKYGMISADVDWKEYGDAQGSLGLMASLPWDVAMAVSGSYEDKQYSDPDENFLAETTDDRHDTTWTASVSLSRPILSWLSVSVSYLFTDNGSNIDSYEYDRSVTGVVLSARY